MDDVDLKNFSFAFHEAWFQKHVWETKKPELKHNNTNTADETCQCGGDFNT